MRVAILFSSVKSGGIVVRKVLAFSVTKAEGVYYKQSQAERNCYVLFIPLNGQLF